jgi:GTPase SAR1 family protein
MGICESSNNDIHANHVNPIGELNMADIPRKKDKHLYKITLIGDPNVGKTSIARKMRNPYDQITDNPIVTIGVDFFDIKIEIKNTKINFQVWDTAGLEKYAAQNVLYFRNSSGAILVYDITNRNSFIGINLWLKRFMDETSDISSDEEYFDNGYGDEPARRSVIKFPKVIPTIILVGNKSDIEQQREVTYREGLEFANKRGFLFCETSAFSGNNIEQVFNILGVNIFSRLTDPITPCPGSGVFIRRTIKK